MEYIGKQVVQILQKVQKKHDFNIKKRVGDEMKNTPASQEVIAFLKPFFAVLLNDKYHQKNRMRLLYNLTA